MKRLIINSIAGILVSLSSLAQPMPEFFGKYIIENDKLIELQNFDLRLTPFLVGEQYVPGFSKLPTFIQQVNTLTPSLIYYDQSVTTNTVRLAPIYTVESKDRTIFYAPLGTIPLKIKPLDKQGMFFFKPAQALATGIYAIYGGEVIGYQGTSGGNIGLIEVTHPRQKEIFATIENFVKALEGKDYEKVASLSYHWKNPDYFVNDLETAKKFKKSKLFSGKVIPVSMIEEESEGVVFYKVYLLCTGALFTIQIGDLLSLGNSSQNFMYVCDKADGTLRVFTRPEDGGWMFIPKK